MSDDMKERVLPFYEKLKDVAVDALSRTEQKLAAVAEQFGHSERVRDFVAAINPQVQAYYQSFEGALEVVRDSVRIRN